MIKEKSSDQKRPMFIDFLGEIKALFVFCFGFKSQDTCGQR